jgi:hypothetical protein
MRFYLAALMAAPSLLAFGPVAQAQDDEPARRVSIEVQGRVERDSNVVKASRSVARAAGIDPADTIISPTLAVDIRLPLSRQAFFLRGVAARDFYQENEMFNSNRFDLIGGLNLHAGFCDGTLTQTYQRNRGAAQTIGLVSTRNVQELNSTSGRATCGGAVGLAPTVAVTHAQGENTTPLLATSDFESWSTLVGLAYRRSGFGRLEVYGLRQNTEFPNRLALVGSSLVEDGYELTSGGIRYERRIGARLGGEADFAYTRVEPDVPLTPEFKGATYGVQAEYRASSKLDFTARVERTASPTTQLGATYTIANTGTLDATYAFSSRLKLEAGILRSTNHYKGSALTGGPIVRDETMSAVYGEARWEMNRRVAILGDLRWEDRDTDVAGLDYSSTRVGVGVVGKF